MAERVHRTSGKGHEQEPQDSARSADDAPRRILDDIDGLLDEIDEVLDVNAEEFVKNYVQKGGE